MIDILYKCTMCKCVHAYTISEYLKVLLYFQMSGEIFSPLDNLYDLDSANCHPLVCHLCQEQYEYPCLLDCYHTFCASCLRGRAVDSRLTCPLCG